MMENVNPLLDFARTIECSIKIPTNGSWYDDDNITFNSIGEVDIKPMLPRDELLMTNPETLISGETIIQVIKSCCPGISKPEDLYYPDVNALLLGIHKATYGDEIKINGICPKCVEKKNDSYYDILKEKSQKFLEKKIKDGKGDKITQEEYEILEKESNIENTEKFLKLEEENKVKTSIQSQNVSIEWIMSKMKFLPSEKMIESANGLKIYLTPYKCKDKTKFTVNNIHSHKTLQNMYKKLENFNEEDVKEREELMSDINMIYTELTNKSIEIISTAISKIIIPSGYSVDNYEHIKEFLLNSDSNSVKEISNVIEELTSTGIPAKIPFICDCCKHEWEEIFHGYNPSDFFGNRS